MLELEQVMAPGLFTGVIGAVQGQHSSQSRFFDMFYEELSPADHLLCKLLTTVDLSFLQGRLQE